MPFFSLESRLDVDVDVDVDGDVDGGAVGESGDAGVHLGMLTRDAEIS